MFEYVKPEQEKWSEETNQLKEKNKTTSSTNTIGMCDRMKIQYETMSGFPFDDVRVHYNSGKPAHLQTLEYTQGNQVYVGSENEKHFGHELDMNDNQVKSPSVQLKPVVQRVLRIGAVVQDYTDGGFINSILANIESEFQGQEYMKSVAPKLRAHEITKYKDIKSTDRTLKSDVIEILGIYNISNKSFENKNDLYRQIAQDVKLKLLGMDNLIGITEQQDGQFSLVKDDELTGRTGKSKILRIYRTMPASVWEKYEKSGDVAEFFKDKDGMAKGSAHGGSLGEALNYFLLSKKNRVDDVLVEFEFKKTASQLIDYSETSMVKGLEGKGPKDGKLTGKHEQNDVFGRDENIFSINLAASKELIKQLNPKIIIKGRVVPGLFRNMNEVKLQNWKVGDRFKITTSGISYSVLKDHISGRDFVKGGDYQEL